MDDIYFYIAKLKELDELVFVKEKKERNEGFIIHKGRVAEISDFAIATGAWAYDNPYERKTTLKNRVGIYWTGDKEKDRMLVRGINYNGYVGNDLATRRDSIGIRPAASFSSIEPFAEIIKELDKYLEVKFGYYPQTIAPESIQDDLYERFVYEALPETGNVYTIDARNFGKRDGGLRCYSEGRLNEDEYEHLKEYEYDGKKYVRACINSSLFKKRKFKDSDLIKDPDLANPIIQLFMKVNGEGEALIEYLPAVFSNGEKYKIGEYAFFEVEPIIWCVDKEQDTILSKNILLGGIPFNDNWEYTGDYLNTTMNWFLNDCFAKEIVQNMDYRNTKTSNNQKHLTKKL